MNKLSLRFSIFCILLIGLLNVLQAQSNKYKDIIKIDGIKNTKYLATVSGIADVELFKPASFSFGMSFSGSIRLLYKPKLNQAKSVYSARVIEREMFIKPTLGYIYRKRYNTALFFIPEIAYRHTFNNGIFVEVNFDAGYLFTKSNAPTYERQDDGTFKKVFFGYHNVILGGKLNAGYDFSKKMKTPLAINFGTGLWYHYPSNEQWTRRIFVEAGLSYVFRRNKE